MVLLPIHHLRPITWLVIVAQLFKKNTPFASLCEKKKDLLTFEVDQPSVEWNYCCLTVVMLYQWLLLIMDYSIRLMLMFSLTQFTTPWRKLEAQKTEKDGYTTLQFPSCKGLVWEVIWKWPSSLEQWFTKPWASMDFVHRERGIDENRHRETDDNLYKKIETAPIDYLSNILQQLGGILKSVPPVCELTQHKADTCY